MTEEVDIGLGDLVGEGFSEEDADALAALIKKSSRGEKANWFKFQEGGNLLRILPKLKGESTPFVVTYQHFLRNWGGGQKALIFNCPSEMGGGRCPACEKKEQLYQSDNAADKVKASGLRAKLRVYARVVDRKNEDGGVQIAGFPKTVFERLKDIRQNKDEYGQDYTHPLKGDDILMVKRKNDNDIWGYTVTVRNRGPQRMAETDDQIRQWLTSSPDIQKRAEVMSYDKITEISAKMIAEAQGGTVSQSALPATSGASSFSSQTAEDAVGDPKAIEATTAF